MPEESTAHLQVCLERLGRGDAEAREELLAQSCERLRKLTRKMLKDYSRLRRWEQSDDVLQNASVRLCRALGKVTPQDLRSFFRLAAVSIRRELIDLARHYYGPEGPAAHHASQPTQSEDHAPLDHVAASSNEPARLANWSEFHQQIAALPDEEQELFDLLWYQGLTQQEAATLLGVSDRTIKRRWQSARIHLHTALQGELPN